MSERDKEASEELDASELEKKTQSLLDKVLQDEVPILEKDISQTSPPTEEIDGTFERLQIRINDLLSNIEDSLKSTEPEIDSQIKERIESISKKLQEAGFGIFTTRAISITKDELKDITAQNLFEHIYKTIQKSSEEVQELIEKVGRGTTKSLGRSTGTLQARLIRLYSSLSDLEQQLETTRAEMIKWRGKSKEFEDLAKVREEAFERNQMESQRIQAVIDTMDGKSEEQQQEISFLKRELSEARSLHDQQQELLSKLDRAEDIVNDYEEKLAEVSRLQGHITELDETLKQKEARIETLQSDLERVTSENQDLVKHQEILIEDLAKTGGLIESHQSEIESLTIKISELNARWDMLFQVAEDEPAFKAYFVIAGKTHWFPLKHLSSALGIPIVLLKRQLQKFIEAGLIEIKDEKIRPLNLSDVARKAAGHDARILEEALSDLDNSSPFPVESTDEETTLPDTDTDIDIDENDTID